VKGAVKTARYPCVPAVYRNANIFEFGKISSSALLFAVYYAGSLTFALNVAYYPRIYSALKKLRFERFANIKGFIAVDGNFGMDFFKTVIVVD
jgi:hypothetical protein